VRDDDVDGETSDSIFHLARPASAELTLRLRSPSRALLEISHEFRFRAHRESQRSNHDLTVQKDERILVLVVLVDCRLQTRALIVRVGFRAVYF
jgi:hypothetical protein